MTDKYTMGAKEIESINSELFNSFDPEQELWIIGGSTRQTTSSAICFTSGGVDAMIDYDIAF